jgi:ABC-type multidrug transport system fused ATPase/permease subunit
MDEGQLIAVGTHEELIETCPVYQRLFQAQVQQGASASDAA